VALNSRAAVLVAPRHIEIREFPLPAIAGNNGLLRIEATGVCGADWPPYIGQRYDFFDIPLILGHEIVGTIERVGEEAAARWQVQPGDRVVVEEPLACGDCEACRGGRYMLCAAKRYGCKSVNAPPSLWGGFSEYLYLDPRARIHPMSSQVPIEIAPLYVPVSNGLEWVGDIGQAQPGSTVLIQGPGQQGLGCVIGALEAGARSVIVTGLERDARRLEVARQLGATHTLYPDRVVEQVAEITNGRMANVVINATAGAPHAIQQALELAAEQATLVVAGAAHGPTTEFASDLIWRKELTVRGVRGRYAPALRRAIALIESDRYPLDALATHSFCIEDTELALRTVGGEGHGDAIHVSVIPAHTSVLEGPSQTPPGPRQGW
jgi:threonine dehydrogenase-like Zn-dependent dehydrogenase